MTREQLKERIIAALEDHDLPPSVSLVDRLLGLHGGSSAPKDGALVYIRDTGQLDEIKAAINAVANRVGALEARADSRDWNCRGSGENLGAALAGTMRDVQAVEKALAQLSVVQAAHTEQLDALASLPDHVHQLDQALEQIQAGDEASCRAEAEAQDSARAASRPRPPPIPNCANCGAELVDGKCPDAPCVNATTGTRNGRRA